MLFKQNINSRWETSWQPVPGIQVCGGGKSANSCLDEKGFGLHGGRKGEFWVKNDDRRWEEQEKLKENKGGVGDVTVEV